MYRLRGGAQGDDSEKRVLIPSGTAVRLFFFSCRFLSHRFLRRRQRRHLSQTLLFSLPLSRPCVGAFPSGSGSIPSIPTAKRALQDPLSPALCVTRLLLCPVGILTWTLWANVTLSLIFVAGRTCQGDRIARTLPSLVVLFASKTHLLRGCAFLFVPFFSI